MEKIGQQLVGSIRIHEDSDEYREMVSYFINKTEADSIRTKKKNTFSDIELVLQTAFAQNGERIIKQMVKSFQNKIFRSMNKMKKINENNDIDVKNEDNLVLNNDMKDDEDQNQVN